MNETHVVVRSPDVAPDYESKLNETNLKSGAILGGRSVRNEFEKSFYVLVDLYLSRFFTHSWGGTESGLFLAQFGTGNARRRE